MIPLSGTPELNWAVREMQMVHGSSRPTITHEYHRRGAEASQ
jgi:hypothetical protein